MKKLLFILPVLACFFSNAQQVQNEVKANKITAVRTLEVRKVGIDSIRNDTVNMGPKTLLTAAAIKQFILARLSGVGGTLPTLQQVYDQGQTINNLPEDDQDTTRFWMVIDDQGRLFKMKKGNKVLNIASEFEMIRVPGGDTLRLRNSPYEWGNNIVHGTDENGVFGAWKMDLQRVLNANGDLTRTNLINITASGSIEFRVPGFYPSGLRITPDNILFSKWGDSEFGSFSTNPGYVSLSSGHWWFANRSTDIAMRPDSLKIHLYSGIFSLDSLQNSNDTAGKRPVVYNLLKKRVEYLQSWPLGSGGGGEGTVSEGPANRLAFYDESGTTVSARPAIAADRVMITDGEGLPTHAAITPTELNALDNVTSNIQDQLNTKLATDGNGSSLTGITKSQVGLSNVDNTSDATKNSAAATLTNKNISGSTNTLSNIPASALTGTISIARLDTTNGVTSKASRDKLKDSLYAIMLPVTLTDGATITQSSYNARVVSGGNRTLAISSPENGHTYTLVYVQDGTGGRKLTGPDGSDILLNTAANDSTLIVLHRQNNGWLISSGIKTSGTYTPTLTSTAVANVITPYLSKWQRNGNQVTVWCYFQTTVTGSGLNASVRISLPIPSALTDFTDLFGNGSSASITSVSMYGARVNCDTSNDAAVVYWGSLSGDNDISVCFTYTLK